MSAAPSDLARQAFAYSEIDTDTQPPTLARRALNVAEASEVYGVSPAAIRTAMKAGHLTGHRVSVYQVILVADLDRWIASAPKYEKGPQK